MLSLKHLGLTFLTYNCKNTRNVEKTLHEKWCVFTRNHYHFRSCNKITNTNSLVLNKQKDTINERKQNFLEIDRLRDESFRFTKEPKITDLKISAQLLLT